MIHDENTAIIKKQMSIENTDVVLLGLDKLMFVEVSLERGKDNPQRIFESLNSTGLALSEADLIRNYILMDLEAEQQNQFFKDYWDLIE
ncbi:GmrSD restriction endonuclease domain-containing protein, partial [Kingella kingae]|uniref:GmrSD restriction endonuclease domain-containing protein n=1 Tax=Kingella kingae TaxID=504 RepID=UPI0032B51AB1